MANGGCGCQESACSAYSARGARECATGARECAKGSGDIRGCLGTCVAHVGHDEGKLGIHRSVADQLPLLEVETIDCVALSMADLLKKTRNDQ